MWHPYIFGWIPLGRLASFYAVCVANIYLLWISWKFSIYAWERLYSCKSCSTFCTRVMRALSNSVGNYLPLLLLGRVCAAFITHFFLKCWVNSTRENCWVDIFLLCKGFTNSISLIHQGLFALFGSPSVSWSLCLPRIWSKSSMIKLMFTECHCCLVTS